MNESVSEICVYIIWGIFVGINDDWKILEVFCVLETNLSLIEGIICEDFWGFYF